MESITLIVTALAAGASSGAIEGLTDNVKDAAKAAYAKLHDLYSGGSGGTPTPDSS